MGSGGMFPWENVKFSEPLEHYFRHSGRTFDVAKCNLVFRETRLLASSLPKSVYRVAGGFVQAGVPGFYSSALDAKSCWVFFAAGQFLLEQSTRLSADALSCFHW